MFSLRAMVSSLTQPVYGRYTCRVMTTTIKVSAVVRDRLNIEARRRGLTAGSFVEVLLEAWAREQRFAAIRQSMAQTSPDLVESYRAEAAALDSLVGDGLAGDTLGDEPSTASRR